MPTKARADDDYDVLLKIVLVGDSGVGKSNLIQRYVNNTFNMDTRTTIGVEFTTKNIHIGNHLIKAQIWDTAGQERFRAMSTVYYRGCSGAIVVYDITNRQTFDNIKKWLRDLRDNAPRDVTAMLVGNKSDLSTQRAVSQEEAIAFAAKEGLLFMETSALAGENVGKAFEQLVEEIYGGLDRAELESIHSRDSDSGEESVPEILPGKVINLAEPPQGPVQEQKSKGCCYS